MDKGLIVHTLILNKNNEFLLIRRSLNETVLPGVWDIPGGTLRDGEDPSDGAIREVKEETQLLIKNDLQIFYYTSNIDQSKNKQFVRLIFIGFCNNDSQVSLSPTDHDQYQWLSLDADLSDFQLVDYLADVIERAKRISIFLNNPTINH